MSKCSFKQKVYLLDNFEYIKVNFLKTINMVTNILQQNNLMNASRTLKRTQIILSVHSQRFIVTHQLLLFSSGF